MFANRNFKIMMSSKIPYYIKYKLTDISEEMNVTIDFTNNCTELGGTFNGTNCTQVMVSQQKIKSVCVIFISIQFDDPFYMPTWRKYLWSIFFFVMVAAADIGNIIGNECFLQKSPVVIHRLHCVRVMDVKGEVIT